MDVDPLSSYEHYNTYQPPYHPQPIPLIQPNIPHTQPNIPHSQPNISDTQPNISDTQPNISDTQPNIPHTQPSIPYPYKDYYPFQNIPSVLGLVSNLHPNKIDEERPPPNLVQEYPTEVNDPNTDIPDPSKIVEEEDIKPDISKIKIKRSRKLKGKTSSYWNKKITDKNFKFYGCSVCNIAFQELTELDTHVVIHTNRVTSYDVRLQNLKKRKLLKKEKKKKKNKVKIELELEIKPEDGYIGTEKAVDFDETVTMDVKREEIEQTAKKEEVIEQIAKKEEVIEQNDKKEEVIEQNDKKEEAIEQNDKKEEKIKQNDKKEEKIEQDDKKEAKLGQIGKKKKKIEQNGKKQDKTVQNGKSKDAVYKCFACNKKFALSYYLKIHVRSHTDEKPYVCNYCGQTFITASKLGRHNKRIHLAVRNQCRICFSLFSRFELLTKHFDKKHADQKLDGEPYDYNAILPYLTELEEQFKIESEAKKPKTEVLWGDEVPTVAPAVPKIEDTKVEKEEKVILPENFEFSDNTLKDQKIEEVEIKCELEDPEDNDLQEAEVLNEFIEPGADSDGGEVLGKCKDPVKEERQQLTDDEDEYFPPGGWARPPAPGPSPPPQSPPSRRRVAGVCELCNRSFSTRSYLKVHMRTHTGEKPFRCYVCGRGFITASKMHRHVLTHDETWVGEDRIKPEGAEIKSEAEDEIDTDKKITRSQSKINKSKAKLLQKPKQKIDPKLKKYRGRPHCCEFCGKKFLHIETLQVHKKSHDGEELVYKCTYCLEPQADQEAKAEHEATHTGPKPYICTLCGRQYKERGPMIYHRKNHKPDGEKPFICDICSKRFDSQAKLARHIMTHTSEKFVLRYECPVCANMFHTRWHVQMHLKSHQKEGLILEENRNAVLAMVLQNARKVPKTPTAESQSQVESVASRAELPPDERSRICNICGQVFQHFYYLEEHLKTHGSRIAVEDLDKEEDKKYTCQVCSKSFKLHYYLKLHSFTHTKEKPFICQQCGKGFITKGKLKRHLETHQGLKKYQCHVCCKFFTRPSYLRIHVRTIHGTQDYNFRDYGVGVPVGLGVPLGQLTDNSM